MPASTTSVLWLLMLIAVSVVITSSIHPPSRSHHESTPGSVVAVQTFGDLLNFNPHLHIISTDRNSYSGQGYEEISEDHLTAKEFVAGASTGTIIEEYLDYHKGPCLLLLQRDCSGNPIHAVWGIPKG